MDTLNSSILYLDDEVDNLIAFKAVFRRSYDVHIASNVTEAWSILENNAIMVIISDQRMPLVNGVDFLSSVAIKYPDIIRMILTGYSDMQAIVDAINKGKIYHYITKPWKFDEFKMVMDKALEAYHLRFQNIKLIEENHKLLLKTKEQENLHLISQLEILKNQINPHFLFNCFNALASLIASSPEMAIKYTTKFSKLFRKSLEHGHNQLVPLESEMDFVNNYFYLQKIRFGNSLNLKTDVEIKSSLVIPPFALQLLVENAIKHNELSLSNPLEIHIVIRGSRIFVSNRIHKKGSMDFSLGLGLQNLSNRCKLLLNQDIEIINDGLTFEVAVPLLVVN